MYGVKHTFILPKSEVVFFHSHKILVLEGHVVPHVVQVMLLFLNTPLGLLASVPFVHPIAEVRLQTTGVGSVMCVKLALLLVQIHLIFN